MNLDDVLDAAAPSVAPRTTNLNREIDGLARACEAEQRSTRRRFRLAVVSGATAAVLAVGAATTATGLVPAPSWLPWSTSSGSACQMSFDVTSAWDGNGEPVGHPFTKAEADEAMSAARSFLRAYDYDGVDRGQAIARWQEGEAEARAAQPAGERQPRLTGDELEITAVGQLVARGMTAELRSEGIDPRLVVFAQGWRCNG